MYLLLTLLLLMSLIHESSSEIDDLVGRAVFPPVPELMEGEPRGHLKPFGWQRDPEGPILEYTEALNANEFWDQHVRDRIPLVYRGYIKDSPAIEKWNDEYLAKTYGDLDVLVEHKLEDRSSSSGRMRLADFIRNYRDQDMYIVSMFPNEMMKEVKAIPSVLCGTFKDYTHESNFWMSAGGTRSVVHYDADHNLHCMLSGRKDFMMVVNNITTKTNLYYKKKDPGVGSGFSFLNPDSIDMHKFKRIADVPWTYATLYPGDCIFIPSQYIHQVRGYGRTIAVTTLFTADVENNFNGDGCTEDIMKQYHSMAEIPFQWTYKKGDATIDMGYMNIMLVKEHVRDFLRERTRHGKISKRNFIKHLGSAFGPRGRNETRLEIIWREEFGFSDDFKFTENAIESLTIEQWKIFCRAVEAPHGVVTDGSEEVFVKPGERHKWEEEHPEEDHIEYMTMREIQESKAASHDPMLHHLSKEERAEYIRKMKEEKARLGQMYEFDERDAEELSSGELSWRSEITWTLDEIPEEYREDFEAGKIPPGFKDEFLSSISDTIKERFKNDFEKNVIPSVLLRELGGKVDPQNEDLDGEKKSSIDIRTLSLNKLKLVVQGIVPDADKSLLISKFPEHRADLEQGKFPMTLLRSMVGSDNVEDFEEDLEELKKKLKIKDEL